jgi:predicted nucleic-acid-binding Zn-ribbon protein
MSVERKETGEAPQIAPAKRNGVHVFSTHLKIVANAAKVVGVGVVLLVLMLLIVGGRTGKGELFGMNAPVVSMLVIGIFVITIAEHDRNIKITCPKCGYTDRLTKVIIQEKKMGKALQVVPAGGNGVHAFNKHLIIAAKVGGVLLFLLLLFLLLSHVSPLLLKWIGFEAKGAHRIAISMFGLVLAGFLTAISQHDLDRRIRCPKCGNTDRFVHEKKSLADQSGALWGESGPSSAPSAPPNATSFSTAKKLAIGSLICGVGGMFCPACLSGPILAAGIIIGIVALHPKTPGYPDGKSLAIAGTVISGVGLVVQYYIMEKAMSDLKGALEGIW